MRLRTLFALCLPLVLIACSGGLLPTTTPAPATLVPVASTRASGQATIAPVETAGPGPSPAGTPGLRPASAENAPEVAAGLLSAQDRDRFVRLANALRARDQGAADWLVGTGLFLADAKLDDAELKLLNLTLSTTGDALWALAHNRTLDGLTSEDYDFIAANISVPSDVWFFDDDIRELKDDGLLSAAGERCLQRIFDHAHEDAEVRKGLALINTLGLPDVRAFKSPVPQYNIQLCLLARLLEQGVPGEYERAAVAAALTYGSLSTLCDAAAQERIVSYAGERVRFLIDADVQLAAAGAGWRATRYPLESLMVLLWAGQGTAYPQPGQPLAQARSLRDVATEHLLTVEDLDRILLPMDSLRQMQDEMVRAAIERTDEAPAAAELVEQWWSTSRRDDLDDGGPNPGQQWQRYRNGLGFAGGVDAGYMVQALGASINLALPWAQLWYAEDGNLRTVPFGLWIEPESQALALGNLAMRATAGLPGDARAILVWWRLPWDNWHLHGGIRSLQTLPLPLAVWRTGIPAGYLLRPEVMKEEEALSALGLAPAPTAAATQP